MKVWAWMSRQTRTRWGEGEAHSSPIYSRWPALPCGTCRSWFAADCQARAENLEAPAKSGLALAAMLQADFILAHGTEALGITADGGAATPCSLERMRELLAECAAAREVPMVVANPDVVTVSGSELRWVGASTWALGKEYRRAATAFPAVINASWARL